MTLSTPYLEYILGAYSLTLISLGLFLGISLYQWRKAKKSYKTLKEDDLRER